MIEFFRICVEERKSIVVSGGTGSGKTTLLNVLSNLIPRSERLITIEDAAELKLRHDHLVALEARPRQCGRAGRRHHPRPGAQLAADAAGPDHRRANAAAAKHSTCCRR